jgi:hypothetical protein
MPLLVEDVYSLALLLLSREELIQDEEKSSESHKKLQHLTSLPMGRDR